MKSNRLNRRNFLRNTSLGFLGAGLLGKKSLAATFQDQENELPKIKEYRALGRTGFKVSNIGFGRPANPAVIKAGINAGVNYIDTAPNYGPSEKDIGSIIHEFDRKSLFITTKIHTKALGSKEDVLNSARRSLERLKVDYVDCFMLQGAGSCEIVKHSGFHDAVNQLKQEGRVRFCGISCHGSYFPGNPEDTMENILMCAIEDGRYDLLLVVYNFLYYEQGERVLIASKAKNIATTIMKSNPVKMYNMFKEYADQAEANNEEFPERYKTAYEEFKGYNEDAKSYLIEHNITECDELLRDVATRFVLNNQDVHCALIDFRNFNDLESHIKYSGESITPSSISYLNMFRKTLTNFHCRIGCNICESECPHNVPVNTILRYNYYFANKRQEKYAMQKYQALPGGKPDLCLNCEGYCEQACPYGVLTRPLLAMAHHNLSIDSPLYT